MALPTDTSPKDRARVDEKYRWNLGEIYPDLASWRARKDRIKGEISRIGSFTGRLGSSAAALREALDLHVELEKELTRLGVYAGMLADEDTRLSEPQGMHQEIQIGRAHV